MNSLRTRLALAIALTGLALSAAIGLGVYSLTASQVRDSARNDEARRAALAASFYDGSGQVVVGAAVDPVGAPSALRRAVGRGLAGTYLQGGEIWAGTPVHGDAGIYVEDSAAGTRSTLSTLSTVLWLVGGAATLAAGLAGWLLANRLSARLRASAAVADRIAAGDLEARTQVRGSDEVGRLGYAIDTMATEVSAMLTRERRFSADVAHELRTPLTGLVNAAALLEDSRPAELVRDRVVALRTLVEDLLEISRLQQGSQELDLAPVELGAFVSQLVSSRDVPVDLRVAEPASVQTDRRRLERVIANLLDNALAHGSPPVTLSVNGATITVQDHGPGFPEELLRDGPVAFRTASDARDTGTGLGLMIATAQASAIGARLVLDNAPEGGARAELTLPARPLT